MFLGTDTVVSYSSILSDAEALAAALWDRGLRPGDSIAFQLPNWEEAAVINLAACRIGVVCAPLMPIYRDAELAFMINDSNCKAVFIPSLFRAFDFGEMYQRLEAQLVNQPLIITVRGNPGEGGVRYDEFMAAGKGRSIAWPCVDSKAVKLLLYTSGTTGRPKAVLHNHETLARAVLVSVSHWHIHAGDVVFMPSPVTHATGYANALELPFLHGTRSVLMDRWDAARAVELIDRFEAVATVGATPFLRELTAAAAAAGSNLSSLRIFACGGATVPPEVIHAANKVLARKPAFRVYGSSEAPYVALGRPASNEFQLALAATTDGQVIDYDVRIVDDGGKELPSGEEGEILVRGPSLFLGYANRGDNQDAFDSDGFFRTGDRGAVDSASYLTITGRKKDLIIRGGENISAKEIEEVLHGHPDITEASVVSMPHERLGEGIFAFIIARDGAQPALADVADFLHARRLAKQKFPERLSIVTNFPRTASGKIRKDLLRKMAADIVNGEDNNE